MSVVPLNRGEDATQALSAMRRVASLGLPGPHARLLDIGSGPYLDYFSDEVLDVVASGGATCRFFEGAYGAGKTHLVRLLGQAALERGMAVAEVELSRDLALEDWRGIVQLTLQKIKVKANGVTAESLPRVLNMVRDQGRPPSGLDEARVPHPGFQQAMLHCVRAKNTSERGQRLLEKYLLGERVSVVELRRAGLHGIRAPLSRRNAEHVLNTVAITLHGLGVPGTMLIFDENERSLTHSHRGVPRRIKVAANLVRRLVDACPSGRIGAFVALFAVLPGFVRQCAEVYPALGQRLARPAGLVSSPWRSPVLRVADANTVRSADDFLKQAVERFVELASTLGPVPDGFAALLSVRGQALLREQAGEGYKRPLMKGLADTALKSLKD
jgi:hypothetical protein